MPPLELHRSDGRFLSVKRSRVFNIATSHASSVGVIASTGANLSRKTQQITM